VLTVISIVSWLTPRGSIDQAWDVRKRSTRKSHEVTSARRESQSPELRASVKVIMHADDSDGLIRDLARDLWGCTRGRAMPALRIRSIWQRGWPASSSTIRTSSRSIRWATRARSVRPGWSRIATPLAHGGTPTLSRLATRTVSSRTSRRMLSRRCAGPPAAQVDRARRHECVVMVAPARVPRAAPWV
jgi:hypothetical protein